MLEAIMFMDGVCKRFRCNTDIIATARGYKERDLDFCLLGLSNYYYRDGEKYLDKI